MTNEEYLSVERAFLNDLKKVFELHQVSLVENDHYNDIDCRVSDTSLHFRFMLKSLKITMSDSCEKVLKSLVKLSDSNDFY